jgi:hypothetical protein
MQLPFEHGTISINQSINVTSHTPLECQSVYAGTPVEEVVADAAPHPLLIMHQTLNMHLECALSLSCCTVCYSTSLVCSTFDQINRGGPRR